MRTKYIAVAMMAILALPILSVRADDAENAFDIQTAALIFSPDSSVTYWLAKPQIGFPDSTMAIDEATLSLWASAQTIDTITYVSIKVYPILIDWNPENVSWTFPWTTPGGDFDDSHYAERSFAELGTQAVEFDLTDLCARWADGRLPYYGFLIGLSESSLVPVQFLNGSNGDEPFATLRIQYTTADLE